MSYFDDQYENMMDGGDFDDPCFTATVAKAERAEREEKGNKKASKNNSTSIRNPDVRQ